MVEEKKKERKKFIDSDAKRLIDAFHKLNDEEKDNLLKFVESDCGLFIGEGTGWGWFGFTKVEHLVGAFVRWVFKTTEHPEYERLVGQIEKRNKEIEYAKRARRRGDR